MVDTEDIGSLCPVCGYTRCMLKYHDSPSTWFTYQACPRCGFAYAEGGDRDEWSVEDIWDALIEHHGMTRLEIYREYKDMDDSDRWVTEPMWKFTQKDIDEFKKLKMEVYD